MTNAAGAQAWLKAALTKAGLGVDSAKGLDEAGTLAATTQAAKLSTVANALADAANKPGAVVADKTSNTGSLTLNVPGEGLYLVVDSDGLPIIVGTKINGKDLEKQALGTAVIKSTSISVDKEGSGDTTIGKTVSYTATFKIPQKNANPTKRFWFIRTAFMPSDIRLFFPEENTMNAAFIRLQSLKSKTGPLLSDRVVCMSMMHESSSFF